MTPLAVAVILACMVALTAVLISMLLSFKRVAQRAEGVLSIVEHEIRPFTTELESLTAELHKLTHKANDSLDRVGGVVERIEELSVNTSRVVSAVAGLTRIGQYAGIAAGVKRGVEVFLTRMKDRHP
ncbi:MAG TPA: DUF948 domain-containing protein [Methylomirabilota bacterium]